MSTVKKNKITFYCLLFAIILVGSICLIFVIKNSFITENKICDDLQGNTIYIRNKEYVLDNESKLEFRMDKVEEIEAYKLRDIFGTLILHEEEEKLKVEMHIKYARQENRWNIVSIIYNEDN